MRKVCEVYLISSSATDERGVELTFPVSQYEMMDAFEQIHTKSPGDVYWQVDEFYCFDYLAPHLDESMSIFEFNSLTEQLSKLDARQEIAMEGLLNMAVQKHMQENSGPITVQELMTLAFNADHCHVLADVHSDEALGKFYVENGFGRIWMPCRSACMRFLTMPRSVSRCARRKTACSPEAAM